MSNDLFEGITVFLDDDGDPILCQLLKRTYEFEQQKEPYDVILLMDCVLDGRRYGKGGGARIQKTRVKRLNVDNEAEPLRFKKSVSTFMDDSQPLSYFWGQLAINPYLILENIYIIRISEGEECAIKGEKYVAGELVTRRPEHIQFL